MNTNPAFSKALSALTHPASLAAMGTLLLNDHFLRRFHPSWLTGKLGDFAWLLFFPFLVAALLALVLPRGSRSRAGVLAIGLVGAIFTLGKTIPAFNQAFMSTLSALAGSPLTTLVDPSDLIALPILFVSFLIWQRANPALDLRLARGWAALPLAALLTLGNTARVDLGVTCLLQHENSIYAPSYYDPGNGYISADGGLTWIKGTFSEEIACPHQEIAYPLELLTRSGAIYRYQPHADIQVSTDGGLTWTTAYSVQPITEPQQELYDKKGFEGITQMGPISAVEDPITGNILFAMGWEGVLLRARDSWSWIAVGAYQQMHPESAENLFTLLNLRLILSAATALMVILAAARYFKHHKAWYFFYILAWLAWISGLISAMWDGQTYLEIATLLSILIGSLLILVLSLQSILRFIREAPQAILPVAFTAFTAMLLFATPYLLWALNIIPQYIVAMLLSVAALLAVLLPSLARFKQMIENATREE